MDEIILPETTCGCFHCLRIFPYKEISQFWDEGRTPVCPYCEVDSVVIASDDMSVNTERLAEMQRHSF